MADLSEIIKKINAAHGGEAAVIAHSFGGLVTMKLMEDDIVRSRYPYQQTCEHLLISCLLTNMFP